MNEIAIPASATLPRKPTGKLITLIGGGAIVLALAGGVVYFTNFRDTDTSAITGDFFTVAPGPIDVQVSKDGELQAVHNLDILCMVEGQSTIQTIVKEGASVKKGDVLITLDSSTIRQKIEDTTLEIQKAEADLTTAKEMKAIQESQNATNLEAAEVALTLAKIDLEQYAQGTYPQSVSNSQTDLKMARITLANAQDDLTRTKALFGKGFVNAGDVQKADLAVMNADNGVTKAQTALEVLTKYTHEMDQASKQNAVAQADKKLSRTQQENAANLSQKVADVQAKEQAYALLKRRIANTQEQLEYCTIKAPADGLVVYSSSNDRNAQSAMAEGSSVRERQPLLRLPDTDSMKAVVRIQEAQVSRLKEGQRATVRIVGRAAPVGATLTKISVLADNGQRFWNPDLKEYPVELTLDTTPPNLKPGTGVMAEIQVSHQDNVLTVPLPAIYSAGRDTYVFVQNGNSVKPAKVTIGDTNETFAEIKDGLTAGSRVLVLQTGQGRDLLEKAGISTAAPTTRPAGKKRDGGEKADVAPKNVG